MVEPECHIGPNFYSFLLDREVFEIQILVKWTSIDQNNDLRGVPNLSRIPFP